MSWVARFGLGIGVLLAGSLIWNIYIGGRVSALGEAHSGFGQVWRWQVRRVGTDYAVLVFLPNGQQISLGTFDTKDEASEYGERYAKELANKDDGTPPLIGSPSEPQTMPGVTMTGTPVGPELPKPIPTPPTPFGFKGF